MKAQIAYYYCKTHKPICNKGILTVLCAQFLAISKMISISYSQYLSNRLLIVAKIFYTNILSTRKSYLLTFK